MPTKLDRNRQVSAEFRANGGHGGSLPAGPPVLLVTSTGAKSGQRRTAPLRYLPDGDRWVVFAGNALAPGNPGWSSNPVAQPDAPIEVGTETIDVTAVMTSGAEREQLCARHAEVHPRVAAALANDAPRQIAVVALVRRTG